MLLACCRVGVHLPSVEVRFEGLEVSGQCYAAGRELPSIWNAYRNWVEVGLPAALPTCQSSCLWRDSASLTTCMA